MTLTPKTKIHGQQKRRSAKITQHVLETFAASPLAPAKTGATTLADSNYFVGVSAIIRTRTGLSRKKAKSIVGQRLRMSLKAYIANIFLYTRYFLKIMHSCVAGLKTHFKDAIFARKTALIVFTYECV
jgi:hypothetical protein